MGILRFSCNYLDGGRLSEAMPGMTLAAAGEAAADPPSGNFFVQEGINCIIVKAVLV